MPNNYKNMKQFKNMILFLSLLISLKITYLAGYLYLKMPIGIVLKLLQVSDENAHEYLWQYLPEHFNLLNFSNNQITLISIPSIDLLLMQTIVISWLCYFFIKKKKNTYFFITNFKNLTILAKLNLVFLFITLVFYFYYLQDIFTLAYETTEILNILKTTYFFKIFQFVITYNIIIHGIVLYLIFQYENWYLFTKLVLSFILICLCTGYCFAFENVLFWKEGVAANILNKFAENNQNTYLFEALNEIYQYYGLNVSFCNPDVLNPCLKIKQQMDKICAPNEILNQFSLYGKGLSSNLIGQIAIPAGTDYYTGCSSMKNTLQKCIDNSMQVNFIKYWNLYHQPLVQYYVSQKPVVIQIPKI